MPGGLSAAAALAARTGARLAWVPRRAGDRGALDAGCLPNLLPGGRPVGGLLVGAVDPGDLADPVLAEQALDAVPFLVSLELRRSAVTDRADVVLPIAPAVEKPGTYMDWEGRLRSFETVLRGSTALTDGRVLEAIAALLDVTLNTGDVQAIRRELGAMPASTARPELPTVAAEAVAEPGERAAVLATWHQLIDLGSLLDGDEVLAGTARPPVVRLGKGLAEQLRVADGDLLTVRTDRGAVTLPAAIADLPPQVVWLPTNSPGSTVRRDLGVTAGAVVRLSAGLPGPILAEGVDQ